MSSHGREMCMHNYRKRREAWRYEKFKCPNCKSSFTWKVREELSEPDPEEVMDCPKCDAQLHHVACPKCSRLQPCLQEVGKEEECSFCRRGGWLGSQAGMVAA